MVRETDRQGNLIWNDEMIARLTLLWHSGISTQAIADDLGISKNAAVGKAHRLGLGRPSPIKRDGVTVVRQTKQGVRKQELKRLVVVQAKPDEHLAPEPALPPVPRGRSEPCCFPVGQPRTPEFRYCDAPSEPGKPYCREHCTKVYVSYGAKPMEQDAA